MGGWLVGFAWTNCSSFTVSFIALPAGATLLEPVERLGGLDSRFGGELLGLGPAGPFPAWCSGCSMISVFSLSDLLSAS